MRKGEFQIQNGVQKTNPANKIDPVRGVQQANVGRNSYVADSAGRETYQFSWSSAKLAPARERLHHDSFS